jgi:hypothetical protein
LTGTAVSDVLLNAHASLTAEESLLIDWSTYAANTFTLTSVLKDAGGTTLESITEDFVKGYAGESRISIDQYDNLNVNGNPVFPIGAYLYKATDYPALVGRANYGWGNSFAYTAPAFSVDNYRTQMNEYNITSRGQVGPCYWADYTTRQNLPLATMDNYYDNLYTGLTSVLSNWGWNWYDEPDLVDDSPAYDHFGPPTTASWHYYSHTKDVNTPLWQNLQGTPQTVNAGYGTTLTNDSYTYMWRYAPLRIGKKASSCDIMAIDYYPYDWRLDTSRNATIALYLKALDNFAIAEPYIPRVTFIETWDIGNGDPATAAPTSAELYNVTWLSIIHGVKGVCWFPQHTNGVVGSGHHGPDPASADQDIAEPVYAAIDDLKNVIFAGPSTITCTATESAGRVDTLVKEYNSHTYLIAARVTEVGVTGNITCDFVLSGAPTAWALVYNESRNIEVVKGAFTDTFAPNAVHIYELDDTVPIPQYPPTLTPVSKKKLLINTAMTSFSLEGNDVNLKDTLTYSSPNLPTGLSLNASTGAVTGTPTNPGIWPVTWIVSDGTDTDTETSIIEVWTGTYYDGIEY